MGQKRRPRKSYDLAARRKCFGKVAELEALWQQLSEECLELQREVERAEIGRQMVLRALVEARDALRVGDAKGALRIIEEASSDGSAPAS